MDGEPISAGDLQGAARELAQQLLSLDPTSRSSQLTLLRQQNAVMHSLVVAQLKHWRMA